MADELELEQESPVADEEANEELAEQSADGEESGRQPEQKPLNLDDDPGFRKWKSTMDKQVAEMKQAMSAAERRAWEAEQREHQSKMSQMDDRERLAYENNLLRQQLEMSDKRMRAQAFAAQRDADVMRVATKKGLDPDDLKEALPDGFDSFVLWEVADDLATKAKSTPAAPPVPKGSQAQNQVDLGSRSGKPGGDAERLKQRLEKAEKNYDIDKVFAIIEEAAELGIEL